MKKSAPKLVILLDQNGNPVRVDPRNVAHIERSAFQPLGSTTIHLKRASLFSSNKIRVPQPTSVIKQALKFTA